MRRIRTTDLLWGLTFLISNEHDLQQTCRSQVNLCNSLVNKGLQEEGMLHIDTHLHVSITKIRALIQTKRTESAQQARVALFADSFKMQVVPASNMPSLLSLSN
jgi:hypothetical protein